MCSKCSTTAAPSALSRRDFLKLSGAGVAGVFAIGVMGSGRVLAQGTLSSEFQTAADKYGVPVELLMALGYANARWETPPVETGDYEPGDLHGMGGYGIMALKQDPATNTLGRASELTGIPEADLKANRAANIEGGAAVLVDIQGTTKPSDLNGWYDATAKFGEGDLFANQVYETLQDGASRETGSGENVTLAPQPAAEPRQSYTAQAASDQYPGSTWYGAHANNFQYASRPPTIDRIVVHVTQGSWSSAINWFKDGRAFVSAHYTIRSSDGFIGQSVREDDIGYHCRDWNYRSIGIEHEGYVSDRSWFTDAMYRSSAKLSAYLCKKYNIPIDRTHVVGHNEVPGNDHTDPGNYWDWTRYINLVKEYAGTASAPRPNTYSQVVDNRTAGRFRVSSRWVTSTYSAQRYGSNYRVLKKPSRTAGNAKFKIKVPSAGRYVVQARWPAVDGYNTATTFMIRTANGWVRRQVDQSKNGGRWVSLGAHNLAAGDGWWVQISSKSPRQGYIIADAVRIVKR